MEFLVEGLGARIYEHRKRLGLTQRELGDLVGVSTDAVSRHERGVLGVGSDALMAYARALGVSAEYLVGEVEATRPARAAGMPLRTATPAAGVPMELARFLSDGRCNPVTDVELAHLARHLADGNSSELIDLEIHLLAHRAERDRTDESLAKFRAAILRGRKKRAQTEPATATTHKVPTRRKLELTQ